METSQLYIVRYYDPALSYLSRIGALMHETMRRFHNQLIRYDDIDKMVAQLEEAQDAIINENPRLKRMKIDRHDHSDHVVIIEPPSKTTTRRSCSASSLSPATYTAASTPKKCQT